MVDVVPDRVGGWSLRSSGSGRSCAAPDTQLYDASQGAGKPIVFSMVRNAALPTACVPQAAARVTDTSNGPTETLTVSVRGLPADTDFDFFVIQVPHGPFGLSWY